MKLEDLRGMPIGKPQLPRLTWNAFAAAAITGIMSHENYPEAADVAEWAGDIADEMLKREIARWESEL